MLIFRRRLLGASVFLCSVAGCSADRQDVASDHAAVTEAAEPTIANVCSMASATFTAPDLAVAADGKHVAFTTCAPGGLQQRGMLLDVATGIARPIDDGAAIHEVGFSDDGRFVHYSAYDRAAGPATFQPHVESTDGAVKKRIVFFEESAPEELYFARRIGKAAVSVSPDGKTAVASGVERDRWNEANIGRVVVAPLDREGQTSLLAAPSMRASATWMESGEQVVLTRIVSENQVRMQVVSLGPTPALVDTSWMAKEGPDRYTIIPGSYDGTRVLRWERDESDASRDRGWYVIANADGTTVELSRDSATVARMPRLTNTILLRETAVRGATWTQVDGKPAVMFPGEATDGGPIDLLVRALDAEEGAPEMRSVVVATDVRAYDPGAGAITPVGTDGAFLYPSTGGIRFADGKGATKLVFATEREHSTVAAMSEDSARFLVRSFERGVLGEEYEPEYTLVDVATANATPLALTTSSALRPFGPLSGDWAHAECRHDAANAHLFGRDGALFVFAYYGSMSPFCKREQLAPELLRFGADGRLDGVVSAAGLARGDLTKRIRAIAPQLHPLDEQRVVVASCGLPGEACAARILSLPAAGSTATPDPTDTGSEKPSGSGTPSGDGTSEPATERPGAETSSTEQGSRPTSPSPESSSCATARGARSGGLGFGLAFLVGLAALRRRRAR
ncbi:MAG: hypothetical protein KIT84_37095 [Labilithrix sp.]|nr:hypothetical protein [Labilithrix sp.]MCW5816675.1 hypothetical protein [Labilithrix sp.]